MGKSPADDTVLNAPGRETVHRDAAIGAAYGGPRWRVLTSSGALQCAPSSLQRRRCEVTMKERFIILSESAGDRDDAHLSRWTQEGEGCPQNGSRPAGARR